MSACLSDCCSGLKNLFSGEFNLAPAVCPFQGRYSLVSNTDRDELVILTRQIIQLQRGRDSNFARPFHLIPEMRKNLKRDHTYHIRVLIGDMIYSFAKKRSLLFWQTNKVLSSYR